MNCIVRRVQIQPPEESRWSYKVESKDGNAVLVTKRLDTQGWDTPFELQIQNDVGSVQLITVNPCNEEKQELAIKPYIGLSPAIPRQSWKIPPIIFQTWKSKEFSTDMKAAQETFRQQNGYTFFCLDDNECAGFLLHHFGKRFFDAFAVLTPGAYRADFWRYCMLYKFGGVYADAKTRLLRPLDEILRPQDELVIVKDVPFTCVLNGFIACKPGHPLLKIAIDLCLERIESRSYGQDALDVTGPHLFGRAICRWLGQKEDSLFLNPGYTPNIQFLGRSRCKKYIISPEGELLMQKEYDSYYKTDMNVITHYPTMWALRAIYADSENYKKLTTPPTAPPS